MPQRAEAADLSADTKPVVQECMLGQLNRQPTGNHAGSGLTVSVKAWVTTYLDVPLPKVGG